MTPQFILRASLCRPPHCASEPNWKRTAESEIENLGYAIGYAEPGYDDPAKAVLFANWNYFPSRIDDTLERAGYAIEWSDEWSTCENCNKAVRTSPDSHGWSPSYVILNDCEIVCIDCLLKDDADVESYLDDLADNPRQAVNNRRIDPAKYGYVRLEDGFESGMHPGQTDDPKAITKALRDKGETRPILFKIDDSGQFDIRFSVWAKAKGETDND